METLGVFKKIMACALLMALLCILGAPLLTLFGQPLEAEMVSSTSSKRSDLPGQTRQENDNSNNISLAKEALSEVQIKPSPLKNQTQQKTDQRQQISKKQESSGQCTAKFGKTLEENIEKIKSVDMSAADTYFRDLEPTETPEIIYKEPGTTNIEVPTIATGASSNHFQESLGMLKTLKRIIWPAYKTVEVYYFDLGLEPDEVDQIRQLCNCTIVKFPFEKYPDHVRRLKGYCWKPLVIKMMLQKRQFVMWLDASVQLTKTNMDSLFLQAKKYGVMMWHNGFSLPAHTHLDTFNFLEEPPCLYKGLKEWHAGLILFHTGHEIVKKYILDPWVKCALIEDCMKTKHDEMVIIKCPSNNDFHGCHRFDQAVLSILIFRLYHDSFRNHDVSMSYFRLVYVKNKN